MPVLTARLEGDFRTKNPIARLVSYSRLLKDERFSPFAKQRKSFSTAQEQSSPAG